MHAMHDSESRDESNVASMNLMRYNRMTVYSHSCSQTGINVSASLCHALLTQRYCNLAHELWLALLSLVKTPYEGTGFPISTEQCMEAWITHML